MSDYFELSSNCILFSLVLDLLDFWKEWIKSKFTKLATLIFRNSQCRTFSGFFRHSDFTWNQFWSRKLVHFSILEALNFVHFVDFSLQKLQRNYKNQNSEPLNVLKWQILRLKISQLWFHVKSEWHKNSTISTLCT